MLKIASNLKKDYDSQYANEASEWRDIGARQKARNIVEITDQLTLDKVLEVGAGEGSILNYLSKWNFSPNLFALEISDSGIARIKEKNISNLKEVKSFDGYAIPYPDKSFDLVILSHVLEHVEFERALLREIKRVSKYQVIEVPRDYKPNVDKKLKHFLDYGHINIYTASTFKFLLLSEGFSILKESLKTYNKEVFKYIYLKGKKASLMNYIKYFYDAQIRNILLKLPFKFIKEQYPNTITVLTK